MKYGFEEFPHYTKGRQGAKVDKIVVHHMATTNFDIVPGIWKTRQASAHYGIGPKGDVRQYVDEANTAWHAGNWNANITSIGIENCNVTGAPNWDISEATFEACARLCADIAKRYGLGELNINKNLFPHSYFSATACPGKLLPRMQELANRANAINQGNVKPDSNNQADVTTIAKQVIAGDYGNGDARKRNLEAKGYNYAQVQSRVNELMNAKTQVSKPIVNLDAIANAVIRGEYGNGEERKRRLEAAGYNYKEVQNLVNKKLS